MSRNFSKNSMNSILLFPFNGNSREAATVIEAINCINLQWLIEGFLDDDPLTHHRSFGRYTVKGPLDIIFSQKNTFLLAVPGRPENLPQRYNLLQTLEAKIAPERFATIIHPSASVGIDSVVAHNCLIMQNVVIGSSVTIQKNSIILPNSVLSHDTVINEGAIVSTNVAIAGCVTIGKYSYIGTGASIKQEVTIGDRAVVGMGAVVLQDIPPETIYIGNPAKFLRAIK